MSSHSIQQYRQRLVALHRKPQENTPFLTNAIVHWISIGVVAIAAGSLGAVFLFADPGVSEIKLQYNVYFGAKVLGAWWGPYVLVGIGLVFYVIDILIAFFLYEARLRIAAYAVLIGGLFAHVALVIAIISIIVNN